MKKEYFEKFLDHRKNSNEKLVQTTIQLEDDVYDSFKKLAEEYNTTIENMCLYSFYIFMAKKECEELSKENKFDSVINSFEYEELLKNEKNYDDLFSKTILIVDVFTLNKIIQVPYEIYNQMNNELTTIE